MNRPRYPNYKTALPPTTKSARVAKVERRSDLPPRCTRNDLKEELALEYVKNFQNKYKQYYPNKPPVWLYPLNEYGIEKVLCSTVRPTQAPYRELYHLQECATFVADYIVYEPLDEMLSFPECLPSPPLVTLWRRGDCFDLSVLLASLLLGNGMDAYCVCGVAPLFVADRDLSQQICPFLQTEEAFVEEKEKQEDTEDNPYELRSSRYEGSLFLKHQEEESNKKMDALRQYENEESDEEFPEDPRSKSDDRRLHCWVMVLAGKRGVKKHMFIEPSTGAMFEIDKSPYLGAHFVWNNQNIWVNIQQDGRKVDYTSFDLRNREFWENVFHEPDMGVVKTELSVAGEIQDDGTKKKPRFLQEQYLDVPGPWAGPIVVERDSYERHFADGPGENISLYRKTKVERYGFLVNEQGLTMRITCFSDLLRLFPIEVTELYKFRRDRLSRRVTYPKDDSYVEFYEPGRQEHEMKLSVVPGKQKEVSFYSKARLDYLKTRREYINRKVIEEFDGSPISLHYRSCTYDPQLKGNSHLSTIRIENRFSFALIKMKLQFHPIGLSPSEEILSVTYYYLPKEDERIQIAYHFEPGRITNKIITLYRDDRPAVCHNIDPQYQRQSEMVLKQLLKDMLERERLHLNEVNRIRVEPLKSKKNSSLSEDSEKFTGFPMDPEEASIIEKDIFVVAREKGLSQGEKAVIKEEEVQDDSEKDYLYPFLRGRDASRIDRKMAQEIFNECTLALKNRLYDRASIIQRRLDEENAALAKKQAAFQRNRDHLEGAEEDYEEYCQEAMFRIMILEQRLARHLDQSRIKYAELHQSLKSDPRLVALSNP